MSEGSVLRLENATATLAEIPARHNERLAVIERTSEMLGELAGAHQLLLADARRRAAGLEEANATVAELLGRHHAGVTEMRAAQASAAAKIAVLAESQAHGDPRLDALIDTVRTRFNGRSESS